MQHFAFSSSMHWTGVPGGVGGIKLVTSWPHLHAAHLVACAPVSWRRALLNLRSRCGLSQVAVPPCGSWWRVVKLHKADSCSSDVHVRAHRVIAVRQARVWYFKDGVGRKARFRFTHCNTCANTRCVTVKTSYIKKVAKTQQITVQALP